MDKRRFLVGGMVALAACAALLRAVHPSSGGDAPALAALPLETVLPVRPTPLRTATPAPVVVYVAGEVLRPGVYRLPASGRVDDAVRAAGGQSATADPVGVNLAERLRDGEEISIHPAWASRSMWSRSRDCVASRRSSATSPRRRRCSAVARAGTEPKHRSSGKRGRKAPPENPVDVNSADAATLETIPGIGPRLAERIVEFRETNGAFATPDELLDVNGISERLLDEISPYLSFGR